MAALFQFLTFRKGKVNFVIQRRRKYNLYRVEKKRCEAISIYRREYAIFSLLLSISRKRKNRRSEAWVQVSPECTNERAIADSNGGQRAECFSRLNEPKTNYPPPWKLSRKYWKVRAVEWAVRIAPLPVHRFACNRSSDDF